MKQSSNSSVVPWKEYLILTAESLLTFYLATFCLVMFFIHRGPNWVIPGGILIFLYCFTLFVCGKRIYNKVSLPAMMIIVPIAPLLALILVVSLIPLIEFLY